MGTSLCAQAGSVREQQMWGAPIGKTRGAIEGEARSMRGQGWSWWRRRGRLAPQKQVSGLSEPEAHRDAEHVHRIVCRLRAEREQVGDGRRVDAVEPPIRRVVVLVVVAPGDREIV